MGELSVLKRVQQTLTAFGRFGVRPAMKRM